MTEKKERAVQVHIPYPILVKRVDDALTLGLNPEVYIDGDDLDTFDPRALREIGKRFSGMGLRITQHGPYLELNPGNPDERRRSFTVERYRRAFKAAEALRPVNIVLHAGYSDRWFKGDMDFWLEQSLKTWEEFVPKARDLGVTIAAENIFETDPLPLKRLLKAVDAPNFRLCIDSGHLNVFSKVTNEVWFKEIGRSIAELHLHDNNGHGDDHMALGDGSIDFNAYFALVRRYTVDPVYTIEPHGEDVLGHAIEAVKRFL